ncbi:hypothetical protein NAEX_02975 [Nannocystis exedens]|nr:hypothetical protein NAEX_02975 [Nannocystis exedens]
MQARDSRVFIFWNAVAGGTLDRADAAVAALRSRSRP